MQTDASRPPRVWAEFDDPTDPRRRFRCDLTWLTSRWTCIYGRGCEGINGDGSSGCCVIGAHFAEGDDLARVAEFVQQLDPQTWQHHPGSTEVPAWTQTEGAATKTTVVDGACIFSNRADFAGGAGCAFHHLAARTGRSHIEVMPEACWQLPLRRTHRLIEHPDGTSQVEVTMTEYARRDWGPGWRDIEWYCTDNPAAHIGSEPVYLAHREVLIELIGEPAYAELCRYAEAHRSAVKAARAPGQRHLLPLLVHEATLAAAPTTAPPPPPRKAAKAKNKKRR